MHKGEVVAERGNYKVIDCEMCGFKHLDPVPTQKEIEEYYKNKYYQKGIPKLLKPEKEARESKWADLGYKDTLTILNKHLENNTKRLLDVGSGNGFFMKFMKDNGWECIGIEPSPKAKSYSSAMELNVFNTTLEEFAEDKWKNYFDAVNLKYVLEHVPHPMETLKICMSLLKPSGMVCIEVPNDFNELQFSIHKKGKSKWWVSTPDHINYFNHNSLHNMLASLGIKVVYKTTGFPMELFILMGDDYVGNDEVGGNCHQKRMALELSISDELREKTYNSLANIGVGRSCIVYGKVCK